MGNGFPPGVKGSFQVKQINRAIILGLALLLMSLMVAEAQTAGTAPNPSAPQAGDAAGLRIISPHQGERLKQDFVSVSYELGNNGASASSTPNFQIQLDGQDPVTTSSTEYTFTGLAPGTHTVTVQLVDANGTPIAGARNQVQFFILKPTVSVRRQHKAVAAALRIEEPKEPLRDVEGHELPAAGGALPLLSVIGFGALLGGIVSAMKTR